MLDPPQVSDNVVRTGHFIFHVHRRTKGAWSWRLRIEVIRTGQWGEFDSMLDAVRFMREHMEADEDSDEEAASPLDATEDRRPW